MSKFVKLSDRLTVNLETVAYVVKRDDRPSPETILHFGGESRGEHLEEDEYARLVEAMFEPPLRSAVFGIGRDIVVDEPAARQIQDYMRKISEGEVPLIPRDEWAARVKAAETYGVPAMAKVLDAIQDLKEKAVCEVCGCLAHGNDFHSYKVIEGWKVCDGKTIRKSVVDPMT